MTPVLRYLASASLFAASAFAALPSVGPDYAKPTAPQPATYRDTASEPLTPWKVGAPADAFARGTWWEMFGDPALNELEVRALRGNQDVRAAAARVVQARAIAGATTADYWPQIAANGVVIREQTSDTVANPLRHDLTTTYRAPLTASWELDLFGRVRRLSESARDDAVAATATFEALRLTLAADVASTYFTLRALEREQAIVENTARLRQRARDLVTAKLRGGTAAEVDVARAETEYATAESDAAELASRRASVQNALAVLVGVPASEFTVPAGAGVAATPDIPTGLPSELLERRPDVAAAERALASANARIGVAKAAFFPAISLTGSAGSASGDIDQLFRTDSRIWSIVPNLYLPIFQGGRNRANLARARGAFDEAVAGYRQRVLVAFREVQDALSATHYLAIETSAQERALQSARRASQLAEVRFNAGYVSYLEVVDAQRTALAIERASVQLDARRLNARVALIKALGGGWRETAALVATK